LETSASTAFDEGLGEGVEAFAARADHVAGAGELRLEDAAGRRPSSSCRWATTGA
jgi:hypothetical protein